MQPRLLLGSIFAAASAGFLAAGDAGPEAAGDGWCHRVTLFGWFTGINGRITARDREAGLARRVVRGPVALRCDGGPEALRDHRSRRVMRAMLQLVAGGAMAGAFGTIVTAGDPPAAYLGSSACTSCHVAEAEAWAASDHARAWTLPAEDTVLGDFDDATFEHGGVTTRFFRRDGGWFIEAEDRDGTRRTFPVIGVAGVDPLQQYLLAPEPGRTQVYDIAWDVAGRRWYPVFPGDPVPPGNGFHWTGPYKSWEARCAECHATGYSRNYDPATRRYDPRMAEIGVGCEGCHGPGSAHVARVADPAAPLPSGLTAAGLTVDLGAAAETELQQCFTCHARREAHGDGNPVPGTRFDDAFSLALLRPGLYHPDGTILDEVFEAGSFLQSRMYAEGVRCSNCHEPHSALLRAEGNAVCTQCHGPAGNPDFPTLRKASFDDPAHHFHAPESPGAQCASCHMVERIYMGVDARRDHSFRIPRPDLAATGAPDACTDCHAGRPPGWAADEIARRFPASRHRGPHFATVLAAARWAPEAQVEELLALAEGDGAGVVRATALELLPPFGDAGTTARVANLFADSVPLVRAAAAGALRGLPPAERLRRLAPALTDVSRSVRIAAARALLDARAAGTAVEQQALASAMDEWRSALRSRADFPETHLQIGGAGLTMRDWRLAEHAFREAAILDPQLVEAWTMVVRIRAATGDVPGARAALEAALAANPDDASLGELGIELGPSSEKHR